MMEIKIKLFDAKEELPKRSGNYLCFIGGTYWTSLPYSTKHKRFNVRNDDKRPKNAIDVLFWAELPELYGDCLELMKDIEWLKEEVLELKNNGNAEANQTEAEREIGRLQKWAWNNCVDRVCELINQLDEPEITLDKAFEKVAESHLMTKEEIWRHLERLEAHDGKVIYGGTEAEEWAE